MTNLFNSLIAALVGAVLISGCGGAKPASQTTVHTESTTEDSTGETKKSDLTVTTTEGADGSQTVKRTEATEHTVPAGSPTPTPAPTK
ncbi:MAG: hypothetical protein K8W52_08940 [Deltaproteobacteria bacterium]|nr:hypothetical protein [Deltaproteobacteria bacterium]